MLDANENIKIAGKFLNYVENIVSGHTHLCVALVEVPGASGCRSSKLIN